MWNLDIVLRERLDTIVWLLKFFIYLFFGNTFLFQYTFAILLSIYIQYHFICYYSGCKHSELQKVWLKQKDTLILQYLLVLSLEMCFSFQFKPYKTHYDW